MTIKATFKDYYSITKPSKKQIAEFKDYYANGGTGRKKLVIDMEATHAGLPLNNPRFYIPSRMEQGVDSIEVGRTPMKILTNHDTNTIPVGKTLDRTYVHTIPEDLQGNPDVLTLTNSKSTIKQQLKAMRNLQRSGITEREDYKGLGHIRLKAEISERAAVEALEDGRLDAISTNFDSPYEVYCSICACNLAKDEWCEHQRGEMYFADGQEDDEDLKFECQWIPGSHKYLEASLVVLKGDPLAVVEVVDTINEDNNQTVYMSQDSVKSGHSIFQFKDSVEEDPMKINGKEVTLSDAEQKIFDEIKKLRSEMKDEEVYAVAVEAAKVMSSDKFIADVLEAEITEEIAVLYVVQSLENKDSELKAEEICNGIRKELQAMKDEKLLTDEEFKAADARISDEGLTKLPESAFCGPEKTFPVPDSAHAVAAKRFADKYEGPVDKVDLMAKISIKAKAFGADSKEEKKPDSGDVQVSPLKTEEVSALSSDDLHALYHTVEKELITRKEVLKRECSDCAVEAAKTKAAMDELGEARDTLAKSENVVTVLRSELKRAYSDFEDQVSEFVKLGAELHTAKVEKVALVGVLTQKYDTLESASEELKNSDFEREAISIMDSFDVKSVTEKLSDGMANPKPKGTVSDPTNNSDGDNKQFTEGLSKSAETAIENIKDCLKEENISGARRIYDTMKSFDMFPKEITFESLSADSKETAE